MNLLIKNLTQLVSSNAKVDLTDSEGRTALMYAVMENDDRLTDFLINSYKSSAYEINQ